MASGASWSGIEAFRLDPATGKGIDDVPAIVDLASRPLPRTPSRRPSSFTGTASTTFFVSFDDCCRGVESDYNIRVGRAENVTGPYHDRDGVPMLAGGGTLVVGPSDRYPGSGHNAVVHVDGDRLPRLPRLRHHVRRLGHAADPEPRLGRRGLAIAMGRP